jgi:membrane glycosyltransferase
MQQATTEPPFHLKSTSNSSLIKTTRCRGSTRPWCRYPGLTLNGLETTFQYLPNRVRVLRTCKSPMNSYVLVAFCSLFCSLVICLDFWTAILELLAILIKRGLLSGEVKAGV